METTLKTVKFFFKNGETFAHVQNHQEFKHLFSERKWEFEVKGVRYIPNSWQGSQAAGELFGKTMLTTYRGERFFSP